MHACVFVCVCAHVCVKVKEEVSEEQMPVQCKPQEREKRKHMCLILSSQKLGLKCFAFSQVTSRNHQQVAPSIQDILVCSQTQREGIPGNRKHFSQLDIEKRLQNALAVPQLFVRYCSFLSSPPLLPFPPFFLSCHPSSL